jgi:hypothetical protein
MTDNKFSISICSGSYYNYYNYLENCDIYSFKQNDNIQYMTEHLGENFLNFGKEWHNKIKELNMIDDNILIKLLNLNDKIGNPLKYDIYNILCSPNSLKYVYFGLLNIKHILNKNLNNFNIIEIGGGYGGQCIILLELLKKFNININKYILIDLDSVNKFQKKYIEINGFYDKCIFVPYEEYKNYLFDYNNYLFSSYSLSEISDNIRIDYYNNILKYIISGFIVWNNNIIDFPLNYIIEDEIPQTSSNNKFLYF